VNDDDRTIPRRRRLLIGAGVALALLLLAGGAFAWWFLRDDAPDEVSIDAAAAQVGGDTASVPTSGTTSPGTAAISPAGPPTTLERGTVDGGTAAGGDATDISGVWSVDTSIGEFSFEDSTGTFVGFRVEEELSSIGSTTAVGRTPEVDGTLTIEGTTVTAVVVEADLTAITTDDSRRDSRVRGALDTDGFPTATFVLTTPIELGEAAAAGEVVRVEGTGDLTIHGVTRTVTIPLEAQLVDETVVVVGSVEIEFGDFDVEVPNAPIVVSADDHGPVELQLFFSR
jgi:polyisoprenoid-binding protein YceI